MKKYILGAVAVMMSVTGAVAQNDYFHIFRSDDNFHSFKGRDVQTIEHVDGSASNGFNTLRITASDGTVTSVPISAIDSVQVTHYGLPEIYVTLQDDPTATELWGAKDLVHPATLYMNGNGMFDDLPEQTVEFRGRGNSTWGMKKKPYRFKMSSKASVCGLKKAKTFALIANYIDCSLMRNAVALWTANYLKMPYSNHCVPVRVYLNGIFKGAYMLTEKIGIGGGSVDIDEEKGILFELDSNYDEDYKFYYTFNGYKQLPVMVKDPDFVEIATLLNTTPEEYLAKWQADFTEFADAVTSSSENIGDYVDLESVANFFIVNSLACNHEMKHPKSFYIHKDSLDGEAKYCFGPVWDFDWAFTFDQTEGASPRVPMVSGDGDKGGYSFLKILFANEKFREVYKAKWDEFVADGYPKLIAYMEEYADLIEPSAKENGLLWPADHEISWRQSESSFEFRKNYQTLKEWIEQRVEYCSSHSNFGLYE